MCSYNEILRSKENEPSLSPCIAREIILKNVMMSDESKQQQNMQFATIYTQIKGTLNNSIESIEVHVYTA